MRKLTAADDSPEHDVQADTPGITSEPGTHRQPVAAARKHDGDDDHDEAYRLRAAGPTHQTQRRQKSRAREDGKAIRQGDIGMRERRSLDDVFGDRAEDSQRSEADGPANEQMHGEVFAAHEPEQKQSPDGGVLLAQPQNPWPRVEPLPARLHDLENPRAIGREPAPRNDEQD